MVMFDTPRAALLALTDDELLERVAVEVLQHSHPELRITGPAADLGRDGFGRALFGDHDEIVVAVSCQASWTTKIQKDFKDYETVPVASRPTSGIFVTNRSTKQTTQQTYKTKIRNATCIDLEIFDLNELDLALRSDALHHIAERELNVRPRKPSALQPADSAVSTLALRIDGFTAPLVARVQEAMDIKAFLATGTAPRLLIVEGPGGIGKTRLAIDTAMGHAATWVAVAGTALTSEALTELPLQGPSVLIVDDAHRARDLSGLPALFADHRYDAVKVIFTLRGGFADATLAEAGLDDEPTSRVGLGTLDRTDIDQIVRDHGIADEVFRRYVIQLAQGNPLLAHTMAAEALQKGSYGWADVTDLLRRRVASRLIPTVRADEHRAAAVALAVLTTADGGRDLARLTEAVSTLPPEPHHLESLLRNLADAGLADGPPYSLRPDALAVVLVADAMCAGARVTLDVPQTLLALGPAAIRPTTEPLDVNTGGPLGIGTLPRGNDGMLRSVQVPRLGAQLSVLAQAALDTADQGAMSLLRHAVAHLLPADGDLDAWQEVLTLAQNVAPATPRLLEDLHAEFLRQWPIATTPSMFGGLDPDLHRRSSLNQFANAAGSLAVRVAMSELRPALAWLLDVASHLNDQLGATRELDSLMTNVATMAGIGRGDVASDNWDAFLQRRHDILTYIVEWMKDHLDDNASTVRVAWRALTPFLTMVAEGHDMGTVESADTMVFTSYLLPDDERSLQQLRRAVKAAGTVLDAALLHQSTDTLNAIAGLPWELRAIGRRGLPRRDEPLPDYAVSALGEASRGIQDLLADRWSRLPLETRRTAADTAMSIGQDGPHNLTEAAQDGNRVAAAAVTDNELQRLLVVAPLDRAQVPGIDHDDFDALDQHHAAQATALAGRLPTVEALGLLTIANQVRSGFCGLSALLAFARNIGQATTNPQVLLTTLEEQTFSTVDAVILHGLLLGYPAVTEAWLSQAHSDRALSLALAVIDDSTDVIHNEILDRATGQADVAPAPAGFVGTAKAATVNAARTTLRLARRPQSAVRDDLPRLLAAVPRLMHLREHRPISGGSALETLRTELTGQVAWHLLRCDRPDANRLERLAQVGLTAPVPSIPAIMQATGYILRQTLTPPDSSSINSQVLEDLVETLRRYLDAQGPLDLAPGHDIAHGAVAVLASAPDQMSRMLAMRIIDNPERSPMPYDWRPYLEQLRETDRSRMAAAFVAYLPQFETSENPAALHQALRTLTQLGGGTEPLTRLISRWVDGSAADRARAASALKNAWHAATWSELVARLLTHGADRGSIDELLRGIELTSFGPDIADDAKPRLTILEALSSHDHPAVKQFAEQGIQRVRAAVDNYEADAADRRRGY